ncbi:hypothetical protein LEP1GSC034_2971 [Leptospira interrogans str. 2003000735]|uniref:Uncharacterized protein n=4 Tax=Leptospira interrogans TaxID=173 RepID=M3GS20_LEPIR|nr:hypothetical protein LEP1GSC027_3428 [Leptospira interrogans str. 2002000624]EKO23432.1 hypothetical protein LEP1GSC104_4420 [Leptospira interrogans str. UI 12621]EKO88992.1 hypothetical protein LEP1GSC009_2982 [Leptospira interrogans serovar Grippotyphosa str. Andaman]EKP87040.1 hypothetical protein LEP1GSC020_2512 [Leptospira interrogans serovar Grippotyphosa str. 2006006986]EKQ38367.1 hypothetical protein LEP1GSC025_3603 [Leptospira interrogans str. 2002000621]EKQ46873.1 hypothetical pro
MKTFIKFKELFLRHNNYKNLMIENTRKFVNIHTLRILGIY